MIDFVLYETLDGGSKFFYDKKKDLQTTRSLFTYVYVLILGGNVEASTTGAEQIRDKRSDFWGNAAFYPNSPDKWINSGFERAINTIELGSSGRIRLEQALKDDLKRLKIYGKLEASVSISGPNRIRANISLEDVGNFTLTWQANLNEEILKSDDGLLQIDPTPPATLVSYEFSPTGDYEFSGDIEPYEFSE
jgi:hypothetical protein